MKLAVNKIVKDRFGVFTNINLALFMLCYFKPKADYIHYDFLYSISYCWNYLIFFTFNGAYFIDNTCFRRMALRQNISLLTFHCGNFILHNLPFIYVNIYIPINVNYYHSLLGCITNLIWCYYSTYGTFDIAYVYVSMEKKKQIKVYFVNVCSIVYAPLAYNINSYIRTLYYNAIL
jgi:hypothetical protein